MLAHNRVICVLTLLLRIFSLSSRLEQLWAEGHTRGGEREGGDHQAAVPQAWLAGGVQALQREELRRDRGDAQRQRAPAAREAVRIDFGAVEEARQIESLFFVFGHMVALQYCVCVSLSMSWLLGLPDGSAGPSHVLRCQNRSDFYAR